MSYFAALPGKATTVSFTFGLISYTVCMSYVYRAPIVTVDCVIFRLIDDQLNVLLIQRINEPLKGRYALPGGYNAAGDTTHEALARVLTTKVGISPDDLPFVEQLYTFDTIARDPRGHAISITYFALTQNVGLKETGTTQKPQFHPLSNLPKLAFDHQKIIDYALERLRSRIAYTNAVYAMLPKTFTLTQLQTAYEAILGHKLDKRNFRKKFLSFKILEPTDQYRQEGVHRPALLYRFKQHTLENLVRSFE
jgi:8-oxo-dGTP diphosphatase